MATMLLDAIQHGLALLYEAPIAHSVSDFLVTDAAVARALEAPDAARNNAERLLLRQTDDSLDITLFVDADILDKLGEHDPYQSLRADNLNDFLIALEGVSHFHYLVWNAQHHRQVTQLEMELQAEVDKFVTAMMLLDEQGHDTDAGAVHDTLFNAVRFDSDIDAECGQRYREANHYAAKYCRGLSRRHPAHHRAPSFLNEVRRFYRLAQNDKIRASDQR
ncbi:MAG: hypothetical protein H6977_05570 [Gammaproteobacteria bacterium]|nr:hypothetical protein [Gammaproteobacteria bacterium]